MLFEKLSLVRGPVAIIIGVSSETSGIVSISFVIKFIFSFVLTKLSKYDENFSGYTLKYRAIHGSDDELPESDKIV